jgi:hypothetical protein
MKTALISLVFALFTLAATPVFASEEKAEEGHHFHLLTFHCKGDDAAGPPSTPQSPPLEVDDPGTPGCNRWEINIVADIDTTKFDRVYELPLFDINYGIGDNIQLKYEVPYLVEKQADTGNQSEFGDSKIGIKWNFYSDEDAQIEMGFYPQLTFIRLAGTIATLPLLVTKTIGKNSQGDIVATANLGYSIASDPSSHDYASAALGLGVPVSPRIAVMGEFVADQAFSTDPDGNRAGLVRADLGAMGALSKQLLAFASIGRSVYSSDGRVHDYGLVGIQILAGNGIPNDPVLAPGHSAVTNQ